MTLVCCEETDRKILLEIAGLSVIEGAWVIANRAADGILLLVVAFQLGPRVVEAEVETAWAPVGLELEAAIFALDVVAVLDDGDIVRDAEEVCFLRGGVVDAVGVEIAPVAGNEVDAGDGVRRELHAVADRDLAHVR